MKGRTYNFSDFSVNFNIFEIIFFYCDLKKFGGNVLILSGPLYFMFRCNLYFNYRKISEKVLLY